MHPATIHTTRLDLIPFSADFMRASLAGDLPTAEKLLGVPLPSTWPEFSDKLARRLRQLEADPSLEPWLIRAIVLRDEHIKVGHIGFHEAPGPDTTATSPPALPSSATTSTSRTAAAAMPAKPRSP